MFDLCSERMLDNEERFVGRNGHRFVGIWDCGEGRTPIYRSGDLKEKEIASWVHEERTASGPVQSGLRVLLSPKPSGKSQPSSGKLPYSKQTYLSLSHAWRIPSTFLRAIAQKLSIVTQCSVAPTSAPPISSSISSSPTIPCFMHAPRNDRDQEFDAKRSTISDQARCILVRGDVDWTWDYTLLLTHDPTTRMTYVLIVGLTATEIDFVLSYLAYVSSTSSISTHPAVLPVILLDLAADETSLLLKLRIKLLSQFQQRTGMDRFNSLRSAVIAGERESRKSVSEERKDLDLDAVMVRLTCLSDWVAAQRGFVSVQGRVVNVVARMLDDDISSVSLLQERLSFIKETMMAAEQKCQYLERSISAQVQTIYSLIAQKDNRLNHSATRASTQIASDSRRIAILTRRDSTDMRIIAAVTLIFLPGTFVATVFSTGLIDWDDGNSSAIGENGAGGSGDRGGSMISKYLWVYFMLSGALTFVVLLAWGLFSWFQKRRMVKQFGLGLEEEGFGFEDVDGISGSHRRDTDTTLVEERNTFERLKSDLMEMKIWKWNKRKRDDDDVSKEEELKSA